MFLAYRSSGTVIDEGSLFLLLSIVVLGTRVVRRDGQRAGGDGARRGARLRAGRSRSCRARCETHLALFVVHGLLLTALVAELRRAREQAEHEAGVARGGAARRPKPRAG